MPDPTALQAITTPLRALGIKLPARVLELQAIAAAATLPDPVDVLLASLDDDLTPDNVAERLRATAADAAARSAAPAVLHMLHTHIGTALAVALRADGDRIVADLARQFAPAVKDVVAAVPLVSVHDSAEQILSNGSASTDALLKLRDATATLEAIYAVTRQLAILTGYGPQAVPVAAVVAAKAVPNNNMLRSAGNDVMDTSGHGRWHRLATSGFDLRLNTATEADALIASAQAATERAADEARRPRAAVLTRS